MSDDQTWRAPGSSDDARAADGTGPDGAVPPPAPPAAPPSPPSGQPPQNAQAPQYGEFAPGGYQQQQPGWQQQQPGWQQQQPGWQQPGWQYGAPGAQPGWAPPPKPGLVPLRPLAFGTLIGAPFQALRRNPKITVGAALLLQGIPTIIASVLIAGGVFVLVDRIANADAADRDTITAGAIGGTIVLGVLAVVISTVFSTLLQGIVVSEVSRETLGEKLTFHALWQLVRGRIGALIGWTFFIFLAGFASVALVVAVIVALAMLGGVAGVTGAVLVGIGGSIGLIVLGAWLYTKLSVVPSALVIERLPLRAAITRSWRLTTGYFWRTFGVLILLWLIIYAVTQVISIPFALIGAMVGGVFAPTSLSTPDSSSFTAVSASQLGVNVLSAVVGAIVGAIGSVVQSAAIGLIYIDLRMRKEGLDLELVRFVEARQTGHDLVDPYTQPAPTAAWPGA
ncbi:hypothetical protein ACPPVW_11605 [Leifsonia sp. McL0607]|uniref:hypothetical protein n=1 Tax=Leifsonia sp. McL0607 TaxID=3415672 RepID=UPI003CEAEC81